MCDGPLRRGTSRGARSRPRSRRRTMLSPDSRVKDGTMETPSKALLLAYVLITVVSGLPAQGAATYVVDRLTDGNATGGGQGSGLAGDLRYALSNAQSGDEITFRIAGTVR